MFVEFTLSQVEVPLVALEEPRRVRGGKGLPLAGDVILVPGSSGAGVKT